MTRDGVAVIDSRAVLCQDVVTVHLRSELKPHRLYDR
jgi:hypothetical protein